MPRRFTILTHDHPFLHWDLLIENGPDLLAWRLHQEPTATTVFKVEPLPAHRLKYLDYEGPISNNRGEVTQWTTGHCELVTCTSEMVQVQIESPRINGCLKLIRSSATEEWTCHPPKGTPG